MGLSYENRDPLKLGWGGAWPELNNCLVTSMLPANPVCKRRGGRPGFTNRCQSLTHLILNYQFKGYFNSTGCWQSGLGEPMPLICPPNFPSSKSTDVCRATGGRVPMSSGASGSSELLVPMLRELWIEAPEGLITNL